MGLFVYDPVLCLLAPRRSQGINWSRHGGGDLPFFSYDFKTCRVFDVPLLRRNNGSEMGPTISLILQVIRFPGSETYRSPAFRSVN